MSVKRLELDTGRCLIVGEVGLGHDGSLGFAHAFIDAIADAGADAVKFQTHIAAAESTPSEPFRVRFGTQDDSRYDYWQRMEFTEDQWLGLAAHAIERHVIFLSSPFSIEAVDLLERVGMPAWKVASGEVGNDAMLDRLVETGSPIILSSGMSTLAELDDAVRRVRDGGGEVAVMQCTTAYPCPPEKVGLNMIEVLRQRYDCPVGLSDHSGTIYPGLAAAALAVDIIEVHATFSRGMFGPDVPASVTMSELRQLVDGVRFIETMRAHPVDKDVAAEGMRPLRDIFTRSLVVRAALPAGTVLESEHLTAKKPGTGMSPDRLAEVIGHRLRRDMTADQLLLPEDID